MSSGVASMHEVPCWEQLRPEFAAWQDEHAALEAMLASAFDELDAYRAELLEAEAQLRAEQAELAEQRALFQAECENMVHGAPAVGDTDESDSSTADLAQLAEQLAQAKEELAQLRSQVQLQNESAEQLERSQQEDQCAALELELEHVRNKAGELADTLARSRSEWEHEQRTWDQERSELQRLLEQRQRQLKEYVMQPAAQAASGEAVESTLDAPTQGADSIVVGSVLAQFERIRNERALRRRKISEGS